ncbi:MAG: hypothetical protein Q8M98_09120 [Candidatus Cloacimonadaceae bacterium]|nr:hypothetical protein [Candidatus Cloacimonadaceae bacterium]MDP3114925.1 hypothetical protein [Candidatus Cloacimonadaceae bacterium]
MRENLGLKIFSLVLALIVWLQITLMAEHKTTVQLKVSLDNLPESIVLEDIPSSLPFHVRGKGLDILRLRLANAQVLLDAASVKQGADNLSLQDYTIEGLPEDINIQIGGPAEDQLITVTADILHQKTIPVQIRFEDDTARAAYEQGSFSFSPEKIVISGAKNRLQPIRMIETIAITNDMLDNESFKLDLLLAETNLRSSVSQVHVTRVKAQIKSMIIENIPIRSENKAQYLPSFVTIKIEGTPKIVDSVKASDILISAEKEPDADGWYNILVRLPEGIVKHAITPTKVRLRK